MNKFDQDSCRLPCQEAAIKQALKKASNYLHESSKDGYWSYTLNKGPSIEATAWCALALYSLDYETQARDSASNFLISTQNRDGGWSSAPAAGPSGWCTGPALLALRIFLGAEHNPKRMKILEEAIFKAYVFLFDSRVDLYKPAARLLLLILGGAQSLHYGRGWPWDTKCYPWVEPSSYALYALKVMGVPDYVGMQAAVNFANHYFYEHACADGGWNHGAHHTLGKDLPSYAVTTGEALVALQDSNQKEIIDAAINRLQSEHNDNDTSLALAWAILALDLHYIDYGTQLTKLLQKQNANGSFGPNNIVSAIATIALTAALGKNLLRIKK